MQIELCIVNNNEFIWAFYMCIKDRKYTTFNNQFISTLLLYFVYFSSIIIINMNYFTNSKHVISKSNKTKLMTTSDVNDMLSFYSCALGVFSKTYLEFSRKTLSCYFTGHVFICIFPLKYQVIEF